MKKLLLQPGLMGCVLIASLSVISCRNSDPEADAYGSFEAEEVIVSAQIQGTLLAFDAEEGKILEKDQQAGRIDSVSATLKKLQLKSQSSVIGARIANLDAQLNVQEEQRRNLQREVTRTANLLKDGAATPQQFDDIEGKLRILDSQTEALRSQRGIIAGEHAVLNAQIAEADNQLSKCRIINPMKGTVLEKYAETGELVVPGKALYKIANTGTMELKVYISGTQLSSVAIGDSVEVRIDAPDGSLLTLKGLVSWISDEVEFTPKIIQTREERVNMVYAVKISVANDGSLKIGMPGEVVFGKKQLSER
jgi:HlyD family secretion protein